MEWAAATTERGRHTTYFFRLSLTVVAGCDLPYFAVTKRPVTALRYVLADFFAMMQNTSFPYSINLHDRAGRSDDLSLV